jgi:hypothetical protein
MSHITIGRGMRTDEFPRIRPQAAALSLRRDWNFGLLTPGWRARRIPEPLSWKRFAFATDFGYS